MKFIAWHKEEVWSKPVGGDEQGKQGELKFVPTTYDHTHKEARLLSPNAVIAQPTKVPGLGQTVADAVSPHWLRHATDRGAPVHERQGNFGSCQHCYHWALPECATNR